MSIPSLEFTPDFLGRYDELELLAASRMSFVYRARQRSLGRSVVVKFLAGACIEEETPLRRFKAEGKVHGRVEHANVLRVIETGSMGDLPYLVLEWAAGGSLRDRLADEGPFSETRCLEIVEGVAAGLAAIHAEGAVHRDVKPGNVLFDEHDHPRITDFGIARWDGGSRFRTESGIVLGTPFYVAPELLLGQRADGRADLYSLGVMLFEMATGKVPFDEPDISSLARAHLKKDPPFPSDMPPRCRALVEVLMAKSPNDRLPSAQAVLRWIEKARQPSSKGRAPRKGKVEPSPRSGCFSAPESGGARGLRKAMLMAGLGMLVLGLPLLWFLGRGRERRGDWASPFLHLRSVQVLDHLVVRWESPFPDRVALSLRRKGSPWTHNHSETEARRDHRVLLETRDGGDYVLRLRSLTGGAVERPLRVESVEPSLRCRHRAVDRIELSFHAKEAVELRLSWRQGGENRVGELYLGKKGVLTARLAGQGSLERLFLRWRLVGEDGAARELSLPLPARPLDVLRSLVTQLRLSPIEDRVDAFVRRVLPAHVDRRKVLHAAFRKELRTWTVWQPWTEASPWLGSAIGEGSLDSALRRALLEQLFRWDAFHSVNLIRELEDFGPLVDVDGLLEPGLRRVVFAGAGTREAFEARRRLIAEGKGSWLRPPEAGIVLLRGKPAEEGTRRRADSGFDAGYALGFELSFPGLHRLVPSREALELPVLPCPRGSGSKRFRLGAELIASAPYNRLALSWPAARAENLSCILRNVRRPRKGFLEMSEVETAADVETAFEGARSIVELTLPTNILPPRLGPGRAILRQAWYGRMPVMACRSLWVTWDSEE